MICVRFTLRRYDSIRQGCQAAIVAVRNDLSSFEMKPGTLQLSEPDCCCDIGHTIIVPNHRKPIAALWIHALAAKQPKTGGKLVIVGRDHAAFARSDELIGIKTERRAGTMPAHGLAFIAGPHRFGSVLNYEQAMPLRKLKNRVEIYRVAIKMHRHDASGPWRDLGCHFARIHVEGVEV